MNKDIRVLVSFRNSTKRKKLMRTLGSDGVVALIDLWTYTAENRPSGILTDMTAADIEIAVDWRGEHNALIAALVEIGWVDFDGEIYAIHNWKKRNPWAFGAEGRSKQARKAALTRWKNPEEKIPLNQPVNADSNADLCWPHADSNAPSPSPSPLPKTLKPTTPPPKESTKTVEGDSIEPKCAEEWLSQDRFVVVAQSHFQLFGYALKADELEVLKAHPGALVEAKYLEAMGRRDTLQPVKFFSWIKTGLENGQKKPGLFRKLFGGADEDRQKGYRVDVS